ncbi:MAG TPA: VOC family protein [Flavobacteriales bacterium]
MGSTSAGLKHFARIQNYISWFEIPVYDIHRASAFYNAIYGFEMEVRLSGEFAMAFFPAESGVGGALIAGPGCVPSDVGPLIYLNAGKQMDEILGRVELAGGRVIMGRTLISPTAGHFALFIDSEGNRLALHEEAVAPAKAAKSASTVKAVKAAPKTPAKKSAAKKATKKR